jgi:hypothetical protein
MTSATATSSSGAAGKSSLKTRIGRDWNTLLRRLRRWDELSLSCRAQADRDVFPRERRPQQDAC